MKLRIYGLLGAAAIAAFGAACKEDPLADTGGSPSRLDLEFSYREVVIGDSTRVTATVRDGLNNPIVMAVTVTSCNTAIAAVAPAASAPLPQTAFYLKGVSYGTTCVAAAADGGLVDTMQVATFPARIEVIGPDTVLSGTTVAFTYRFFDAAGNQLTGIPAPTWSSSSSTIAAVDATGNVSGRAPGQVRVTATGVGSPVGGITFGRTFVVVPGPFTGTITPGSGAPADVIKFTRAAGAPAFDADTRLSFGPNFTLASFVDSVRVTADSIKGTVPLVSATGSIPFVLTNIGPNQVALAGTFTISSTDLADPYDAVNNDPSTAPGITEKGAYFITLSGACTSGAGGAGTDCDDFFTVANPSATDSTTITARLGWIPAGADIDIIWCRNVGCTSATTGGGATLANPETSVVRMPPGAVWYLWLNLWEAEGVPAQVGRVTIGGLP